MKTFLRIEFFDCFPHRLQHFFQCNKTKRNNNKNHLSHWIWRTICERCTQSSIRWAIRDSKFKRHFTSSTGGDFNSYSLTVIREHMWVLMVTARNSSYYYCYYCQVSSTRTRHRHLVCWLHHTRHTHSHHSAPQTQPERWNAILICSFGAVQFYWYVLDMPGTLCRSCSCVRVFVWIVGQTIDYRMLLPQA